MKIALNGELYELEGPLTVNQLLAKLEIDPRRVAVEHNLIVLKRAAYDSTLVNEGDEVELVNFVGGGEPKARPAPGRAVILQLLATID